ncbi:hypothetical protein B0H19DRAFT_1083346 [Mycena capillaripes]|nr:hypothetical protein B0H19DRAFT_1083346 [Mycena capillaripes]
MAAAAILNDVVPYSVPSLSKLPLTATTFRFFSLRFLASVGANGHLGHFDGTDLRPVFTNAPLAEVQAEELTNWDKAEQNAKALILQRVPDPVALLFMNPP